MYYSKKSKSGDFMSEKKSKKDILQFIKFVLFSASAGIIQFGSFTLMKEVIIKLDFFQNLMLEHETFARIMNNEYGPMYLIALILSVIWNFTFNRKFTFKSANNVPIAMLKVFAYYAVFTPISTVIGVHFTNKYSNSEPVDYIVLIITMLANMITEFIFDKFVVFRNSEGTAEKKK